MSLRSGHLQFSISFAITGAIGLLIAHGLGLLRGYWVLITICVLLLRSDVSVTFSFTSMRIVGTIVGAVIGLIIIAACRIGEENLCDKPRSLGVYTDGGYAQYVLVPSYKYLVKIGDDMDTDMAAPLSCAGLTAYGAVKNANLKPDDNVVIVGTGGLGLMAIQLARAVTGANIIAMDLDDQKLKVAKKNGANNIINSKKEDAVKGVMELTDKLGADAVIDFVNASKTVETDMQFLRRRARLVLVGLFGGELRLALIAMPTRAYKIIGSYTGTLNDMVELVSLAKRDIIKPVVSNRFKLDQAGEALQMLKDGKVVGRGVINP